MDGKCFSYGPCSSTTLCLDSALDELGMLSTTTKCGLELEKKICPKGQVHKKHSSKSLSSVPLYVVQMDPKFVTKFSAVHRRNSSRLVNCELSEESRTYSRLKEIVDRRRKRAYCPYKGRESERATCNQRPEEIPGLVETLVTSNENPVADFTKKTNTSSLIVPLQDCGRKSNPSSPVKSQNSSTSVGCSIFRSRSLDDLEISKLNLKDDCHDLVCHGDIDTVSQRISKLHVS